MCLAFGPRPNAFPPPPLLTFPPAPPSSPAFQTSSTLADSDLGIFSLVCLSLDTRQREPLQAEPRLVGAVVALLRDIDHDAGFLSRGVRVLLAPAVWSRLAFGTALDAMAARPEVRVWGGGGGGGE